MIEWVVYYTGGERYTSADTDIKDLPSRGVQVILVPDPRVGRRVLKLCDYYLWRPNLQEWTSHEDSASLILALSYESWGKVLIGEHIKEKEFEQILIRAHNDPDLPPRSPSEPPHKAWKE